MNKYLTSDEPIKVNYSPWAFEPGEPRQPAIRITTTKGFVILKMEEARKIIDSVHDICDQFEHKKVMESIPPPTIQTINLDQEIRALKEENLLLRELVRVIDIRANHAEETAKEYLAKLLRRNQTIDALRARISGGETNDEKTD